MPTPAPASPRNGRLKKKSRAPTTSSRPAAPPPTPNARSSCCSNDSDRKSDWTVSYFEPPESVRRQGSSGGNQPSLAVRTACGLLSRRQGSRVTADQRTAEFRLPIALGCACRSAQAVRTPNAGLLLPDDP